MSLVGSAIVTFLDSEVSEPVQLLIPPPSVRRLRVAGCAFAATSSAATLAVATNGGAPPWLVALSAGAWAVTALPAVYRLGQVERYLVREAEGRWARTFARTTVSETQSGVSK